MSTINNLKEFLAWRGFGEEEPYYWARCFYKYTSCGPWAVFLVRGDPPYEKHHREQVARFRRHKDQAALENPGDLTPDFVKFLGYDEYGLSKKERAWDHYLGLVDKYIEDPDKDRWDVRVSRRDGQHLHVTLPAWEERFPATTEEIYYDDLRKEDLPRLDNDNCTGIKFGSIVEGSEVCSGPFTHEFPFETEDFDRDVEWMEKETSFYWKRDNASWYRVVTDEDTWVVANVWGDIEWEEGYEGHDLPDDVKAAAEKAIEGDWQDHPDLGSPFVRQTIPEEPGFYSAPKKGWEPMALGDTGATIATFINDDIL